MVHPTRRGRVGAFLSVRLARPTLEVAMPDVVQKRKGKRPWKVVEKATGKVKGSSTSKAKAQRSANARAGARHGWAPTGKKARKR